MSFSTLRCNMDADTFMGLLKALAYVQGLSALLKVFVSLFLVAVAAVLIALIWQPKPLEDSNVTIARGTTFLVNLEPDIFQTGLVLRLYNGGQSARRVKSLKFEPLVFLLSGGNGPIRKMHLTEGHVDNEADTAIQPGQYADVKFLLPLKWEASLRTTLQLVFLTPLTVSFGSNVKDQEQKAERYGSYTNWITMQDWRDLISQRSQIDLDQTIHKDTPENTGAFNSPGIFIVFSPDRTASIDVYGFDNTEYRRSDQGAITALVGNGEPKIRGGWVLIGRGYRDLLTKPEMVALYNKIVSLNADGSMRDLTAGFRAADRITFGPFSNSALPLQCDFAADPPFCRTLKREVTSPAPR